MADRLLDYAIRGDLRKVRRCLERGVNVDACDGSGNSSLYYAVGKDQQDCVEYLLSCGADPNRINNKGYTPLNKACLKNNVRCLELLVQYGGSLKQISPEHKESPVASARKKQSTDVLKFIKMLKNMIDTENRYEAMGAQAGNDQKVRKNRERPPTSLLPQVTADELKAPQTELLDDLPHMTLQSALWHSTPVTVKHFKGGEGNRQLLRREVDVLSRLSHPQVALLMAVCLEPGPDQLCLVMEHFHFSSLNHLLYETQAEINLTERVHLLLDISEGMIYVHSLSLVHGFLNSFSIFIKNKFRAKIGNFEFSQIKGARKHAIPCCAIHESWMAPEQLLNEPPDAAADIYSFGVLMWETFARKRPWSWLTGITVKQALCVDNRILPMLELWPSYIQYTMKNCLDDPVYRPSFLNVYKELLTIKKNGEELTSDFLDGAFPDWYESHMANTHAATHGKTRTTSQMRRSLSTSGTDEIHVMLRRSSSQWAGGRRSTHVADGMKNALKVLSNKAQSSPREREIEQFGYETAERLESVRNIRRRAKNCTRRSWAKDVALTRIIEGDIERARKRKERVDSTATKDKASSRSGRRYSVLNESNFDRLLATSTKYLKKDWSKVLHGMEKLRHSMKGFKDKVEDELAVHKKKNMINDDSVPETGMVETIYENIETAKESTALFPSFGNKTRALSTQETFSERSDMQEIQHSKDGMGGPSLPCDESLQARRKYVTQELDRQLATSGKGQGTTSNARRVRKTKNYFSSGDKANALRIDVHEGSRPRGNLGTQEITTPSELRASPVVIAKANASESPIYSNFNLLNPLGEIQRKVSGEPIYDKSKTRDEPELEYQDRRRYLFRAERSAREEFRQYDKPRAQSARQEEGNKLDKRTCSPTANTRDKMKKATEIKDTVSGEDTVQLSQEFSGVQVLYDKLQRQQASKLRAGENVETNSLNPTPFLGKTSSEYDNPRSCKKSKRRRSSSLGQEPAEGVTMKCNSLMTKSADGGVSHAGNKKVVEEVKVGTSSNALTSPQSGSLGGEFMETLRWAFGWN